MTVGAGFLAKQTGQEEGASFAYSDKDNAEVIVYTEIIQAIMEQRLAPGTRLTEESLSGIFGVSRSIVRKTLARLSYEKIVELRPNRGAIVAEPTLDEARMVFDARIVLEKSIVASLPVPLPRRALADLRRLVDQENEFIQTQNQFGWIRLSGEFHVQIAQLSGNHLLAGFLSELVAQTSLAIALYSHVGVNPCSNSEHLEICIALEKHNFSKASELMKAHLEACKNSLAKRADIRSDDLATVFGTRNSTS